jgi:hypothetical protein
MTVYVVQEKPGVDMTDALRFGDFQELLPRKDQLVISSKPVIHALRKKLKDFSDEDYILCLGDPSIIAVVAAVASDLNRGRFKLLKWDRRLEKYYPVEVNIN